MKLHFEIVCLIVYLATICPRSSDPIYIVLGASEVSANLYCNSCTSVLGRLHDNLRLLMKHSVYTVCPGSTDPFYIENYCMTHKLNGKRKWVRRNVRQDFLTDMDLSSAFSTQPSSSPNLSKWRTMYNKSKGVLSKGQE